MQKITRNKHTFDAKGKILGRIATEAAILLRGKNKVEFVPYLDVGDFVTIINAKDIILTGRKSEEKKYWRHSGYIGSIKQETTKELFAQKPEEIIRRAISGMLPKNKLRKEWLKRLKIYKGNDSNG